MSARRLILTVMLVLLPAGCAGSERHGDSPSETSTLPASTAGPSSQPADNNPVEISPEPLFTPKARERPIPPDSAAENQSPAGGVQAAMNTEAAPTGQASKTTVNTGQTQPRKSAGTPATAGRDSRNDGNNGQMPPAVTATKPDNQSRADDATAGAIASAKPQSIASAPAVSGMATANNEADGAQTVLPRMPGKTGEEPVPAPGNTANNGQTQPGGSAGAAARADKDSQVGADSGPMPPAVTTNAADEPPQVAVLRPDGQGGQSGVPAADATTAVIDPDNPPEPLKPQSFEDKSLDCDVIELMGKAIGRWRRQGEDRKPATDKAIEEVLQETGSVRDRRFVFGGRVYGMLIYRLKKDHTVEGFGAYANSACLVLRGGKGIVPADEASEARLDQALTVCESSSQAPGELNACISERMEEIVRQHGARNG